VLNSLEEGYVEQWDSNWKKVFAPTRINLNKRKLLHKPNKNYTVPIFEQSGFAHHSDIIENIIKAYFKYKKFKNVNNVLENWTNSDQVHLYMYKDEPIAVSMFNIYDNDIEGSQFCWDYKNPKLKLGHYSLKRELDFYKLRGYDYLYLCESTGPEDTYKTQYDGFEWFDNEWKTDTKAYIHKINSV
tara:strand:- start:339 stop:896 length:558 start_codon:yes stop_codon:yes gene_type:complete